MRSAADDLEHLGGRCLALQCLALPATVNEWARRACGYGADPAKREDFRAEGANTVSFLREQGMEKFAARYAFGPTRVQLENKSPRAFAEFKRQLAEHSAIGSANTQLGVQRAHAAFRVPKPLSDTTVYA